MGRGATSPKEITGICISPDRDGGTRPRRRGGGGSYLPLTGLGDFVSETPSSYPSISGPISQLALLSPLYHLCSLPSFLSAGHTFFLSRYFSFLLPTRKNSAGKDNFLTEGDKTAAELHSDFITFQTVKQPILKHINDPGTKTGLACILNTHLWSKCTFQLF